MRENMVQENSEYEPFTQGNVKISEDQPLWNCMSSANFEIKSFS